MQLIFLFPFIVLPILFAFKIQFTLKNYFLILFITTLLGCVFGLAVFNTLRADGLERELAFVMFYGIYTGVFMSSLYAIVTHLVKLKIPDVLLAMNFGFFLVTFSLVALYGFGYEDIFLYYNEFLGVQALPKDIWDSVHDVLLVAGAGIIFAGFSFTGSLIARRYK